MLRLAQRNGVRLPYADVDEIRAAYEFSDLQSCEDIYYAGAGFLQEVQGLRDLSPAYLERARPGQVWPATAQYRQDQASPPAFMPAF